MRQSRIMIIIEDATVGETAAATDLAEDVDENTPAKGNGDNGTSGAGPVA